MTRLIITFFLFIVSPQFISGQVNKEGVPLIENISTLNTPGSEQNWTIIRDKRGLMYFGNQEGGIIEYDGHFWNMIPTPNGARIYDMKMDEDGTIYIGSIQELGYLAPGANAKMEYVSLMPKIDSSVREEIADIYAVEVADHKVYFSTLRKLFIYDTQTEEFEIIDHSERFRLTLKLAIIDDHIFLGDNSEGLVELKGDSLVMVPGGEFYARMPILSIIPGHRPNELIIGSYFGGLSRINYETGEVDKDFVDPSVNDFLMSALIYNGFRLTDSTFVVGTSSGGSFVFNDEGELLEQFTAENSNLLDQGIFSMYFDDNEGYPVLWLTNFSNISKAYMGIPFKVVNMDLYSNAALNNLMVYKGDLYVSNDVGLMRNTVDDKGYLSFDMIEGINVQTFPLLNFKYRNTDLLVIGTISGLFTYDGKNTVKIDQEKDMYVRSMIQSRKNPELLIIGQELGSVDIMKYDHGTWDFAGKIYQFEGGRISGNVLSIAEDDEGAIWFTTDIPAALYRVTYSETDTIVEMIGEDKGLSSDKISNVINIDRGILVGTGDGLFSYNAENDRFIKEERYSGGDLSGEIGYDNIYQDSDGDLWFGVNNPRNFIYYYPADIGAEGIISKPFYMLPNTNTTDFTEFQGNIWIAKSKQLYVVKKSLVKQLQGSFKTLIRKVIIDGDSTYFDGTFYTTNESGRRIPMAYQPATMIPEFRHSENDVSFYYSSPFFLKEDSVRFSYILEGFDKSWSRWDNANYRDYTNLPHGHYTFRVRSRNMLGSLGDEATYEFSVRRPWYLTLVAMFVYLLLAVLLVYIIIKVYTRRLLNENIRLEGIVEERTREVVRQKEELEASIHYASRIQRAILPSQKLLKERVLEYFILFRPRDIVSGDFYWITEASGKVYVCAADCTGHGVPGAFMSLLGISFLDEIVNKSGVSDTHEILNALRLHVTNSLKQMGENDEETKDGMDLGLLAIDLKNKEVEFSGAYNPCWTVREMTGKEKTLFNDGKFEEERGALSNGEFLLQTIDADRMPIGISSRMNQPFSLNKLNMTPGVTYYLSSDGYSDQFGGANGRKFLKKNVKKLLLEIQSMPLEKQKELLEQRLLDWMGDQPQVDDILVIGVRIV